MTKIFLIILLSMSAVVQAAPTKKIEACVADGGVWINNSCYYMSEFDECTPATQFVDCQGGTTSATGPGICLLGEAGYFQCDYLYQQECRSDRDCAAALGLKTSAYVCCETGSLSRCLNPLLCR
jgi:hypothetical protein